MQQYLVKETLHTDCDPTASVFVGRIVPEKEANYVLAGKGSIISEADAARLGLLGTGFIELYDPETAARKREEAAKATHGVQGRALADAKVLAAIEGLSGVVDVVAPVESEPVAEPKPDVIKQRVKAARKARSNG